ncbi:DUF2489 domain-containing protein [Alloalcanivorax dieselolei]|nr:DUF2489 domain-containing protein [Alloalcanivorax dieselolei]
MAAQLALAIGIGLLIGVLLGLLIWRWMSRRREAALERHRHAQVLESLEVLSRAYMQGQVDAGEASLRMAVLLDCLPARIAPKVDLSAIHQLASDCENFHRGDARKALPPAQRNREDLDRLRLEDEQAEAFMQATERLAGVLVQWRQQLCPRRRTD